MACYTIYILEDSAEDISRFVPLLKGDRRRRYQAAVRAENKRDILVGSLFYYFVLVSKEKTKCDDFVSDVFSKSIYQLPHKKDLFLSNSNSRTRHCLGVGTYKLGVDIEYLADRNKAVYTALSDNTRSKLSKERFYQSWLKKECLFKVEGEKRGYKMTYLSKSNYLIGIYGRENIKIKLKQILLKDVLQFMDNQE